MYLFSLVYTFTFLFLSLFSADLLWCAVQFSFCFILFQVCQTSWICGLMSLINFRKFVPILFSDFASMLFSFPLLTRTNYKCIWPLLCVSYVLTFFYVFLKIFSFCSSNWIFSTDFFFGTPVSSSLYLNCILNFLLYSFSSIIYIWFFYIFPILLLIFNIIICFKIYVY